jgi:hypothetical protein
VQKHVTAEVLLELEALFQSIISYGDEIRRWVGFLCCCRTMMAYGCDQCCAFCLYMYIVDDLAYIEFMQQEAHPLLLHKYYNDIASLFLPNLLLTTFLVRHHYSTFASVSVLFSKSSPSSSLFDPRADRLDHGYRD